VLNNYPCGLNNLITENQCGLVVPKGNPVALADGLERLVNDNDSGMAMGWRGRVLAEEEFSRLRLSEAFVAVVTEL